ncbi:hypothetical protein [Photobacterium leiognathi]|uniref:hypothetical protein n=1 Tax=Photobacterium leiognathi TaxID=553611 RepID=UPI00273295A2|nr:hypothetical protein [Photobacterium leiognathi]
MKLTRLPFFILLYAISFNAFAESFTELNENIKLDAKTNTFYSFIVDSKGYQCEKLKVSGFMFGHAHGLPTEPLLITKPNNKCLLDGLYFNMRGQWKVKLSIGDDVVSDYSFTI